MRLASHARYVVIGLLCFLGAASIAAQDAGPAEPNQTEIIVPEFILRVEELGAEEVQAVLPSTEELALGRIDLPLPKADELAVSDVVFSGPLPSVTSRPGGPSVFSTGRLGAGSVNHVLGELSIYKLGTDPRFRLGFAHEGLDGFNFNPAGTGYYSFTNSIDGWMSAEGEPLALEGEASFVESEHGLQDQSAYHSVSIRSTDGHVETTYTPDPLISIQGGLDAEFARRLQTTSGGAAVPTDQELSLHPAASATFTIRAVDLTLASSYFFRLLAGGVIPVNHGLDFSAGLDADLPWSMTVAARAGVYWDFAAGLSYPWDVSVQGIVGDALELGVSGGYRVEQSKRAELWAAEPLLATVSETDGSDLAGNGVWYAGGDIRWTGVAGLSVRSEIRFTAESARLDMQPYDPVTDEFPWIQRPMISLQPALNAAWQPSPVWQFEASWKGTLIDRTAVEPASVLAGAIRFAEPRGVFRADLEATSSLYPAPDMPVMDLSGTITASEGVEVVVDMSDLLAPLMSTGRPTHSAVLSGDYPFIEPGFVATIFARITL